MAESHSIVSSSNLHRHGSQSIVSSSNIGQKIKSEHNCHLGYIILNESCILKQNETYLKRLFRYSSNKAVNWGSKAVNALA